MVVGFTATYAISAYHTNVVSNFSENMIIFGVKRIVILMVWFGIWCLTSLSTIFQLYRGA
jgi:hypothetical protein